MPRHDPPNLYQRVGVLDESYSGRLIHLRLVDAAVEQRPKRGTTAMTLRALMIARVAVRLDKRRNA